MAAVPEATAVQFQPNERFSNRTISPIMAIADEARKLREAGEDIIVLAAGEPDFDTPVHVKKAACRAIADGQTKYTAVHGTSEMKRAVRNKFKRDQNIAFSDNEICVAAGAKQLLFNALAVTLREGDEVVVPLPCWGSYGEMTRISGGIPVAAEMSPADDFVLRPKALENAISSRTRWLMINNPGNPTGTVHTRDELSALADVLRRHEQVWILCDEIYEGIVFDKREFVSFSQVAPDLRSRTLLVNGVSKTYAMTGWRIGYGAGPSGLVGAMAALQSQCTTSPASISQAAAIAALEGPDDEVRRQREEYERRRNLVVNRLNDMPGITCKRPGGAFYVFASINGLLGKKHGDTEVATDLDFVRFVLDEAKVAIVPGSPFGAAAYVRISFATSFDQLEEGLSRLERAVSRLHR